MTSKQKNIPDGWKYTTLENIVVEKGLVRGPFGGTLKKDSFVEEGYKVYEQQNAIYQSTNLGKYKVNQKKFDELKRFQIAPGDFIVSCSGTIGKIFQIPKTAPEGVINQALLKIRIDGTVIDGKYFYYQFIWDRFQAMIIDNTQGGAMQNLVGMEIFRNTKLFSPPLPEQHRIVEVLEVWDGYLEKLDGKITIKKQIKKGLMQQLLTGKKRLPGFSEEWKLVAVREVFEYIRAYAFSRENLQNGLLQDGYIGNIHYGDIHATYQSTCIDLSKVAIPLIVDRKFTPQSTDYLRDGDMVMADASEDFDGVGVAITVHNVGKKKVVGGLHTFVLRDRKKMTDGHYRQFIFVNSDVKTKLKKIATGVSVYSLSKTNLNKVHISLPGLQEQTAIANILTAADDEITILDKKREIIALQKKFLLNNLITGELRLPEFRN